MNDLDFMRLRADILFVHDRRGRMLHGNDLDGRAAPRLFLGYTHDGFIARFGSTVSDSLEQDLTRLLERFSPTGDLRLPVDVQEEVSALLDGEGPRPMETGPAFRFPDSIPGSGEAVQLTKANVEVARPTFPWLLTELPDWWPCFAIVRDGIAVSICFSSRIGPRACEAGVDTLPAFRGRGFASAVTAAWAASIQASGRIPLYSTSWDNLASQGVARHLGLIMFGADASWT